MTKEAIKKRCRDILYNFEVIYPGLNEFEFLISVFENHKHWEDKRGVGVDYFYTKTEPKYRTKCFWLKRIDGSETDISFIKCIDCVTPLTELQQIFRKLISDQIINFKEDWFYRHETVLCPITLEQVTYNNCHADHVTPFKELFENFIEKENINPFNLVFIRKDNQIVGELENKDIMERWKTYHKQNAILRIVSIKANLSILKKSVNS